MKRLRVVLVCGMSAIILILAGIGLEKINERMNRIHHCNILISFAMDKIENENLSEPDIVESLISNVYAAYQFCDKPELSEKLHSIWNTLIFHEGYAADNTEILQRQLMEIQEMNTLS